MQHLKTAERILIVFDLRGLIKNEFINIVTYKGVTRDEYNGSDWMIGLIGAAITITLNCNHLSQSVIA
jgi:hypothetical protein